MNLTEKQEIILKIHCLAIQFIFVIIFIFILRQMILICLLLCNCRRTKIELEDLPDYFSNEKQSPNANRSNLDKIANLIKIETGEIYSKNQRKRKFENKREFVEDSISVVSKNELVLDGYTKSNF